MDQHQTVVTNSEKNGLGWANIGYGMVERVIK